MKRLFAILLLLLLPLTALADALPATESWTPPDLSGLTADSAPELRVLAIAQQEVGYKINRGEASKYSVWFDGTASPWCAEFVAWCAFQADEKWQTAYYGDIFPDIGTTTRTAVRYLNENRYIGADGRSFDGEPQWLIGTSAYLTDVPYIPQPGDLLWLYLYGGRDNPDHTTIVEGVSQDASGNIWVHVIEGNMENSVRRHAYTLDDRAIVAYGTPEVRACTRMAEDSRYGGVNALRKQLLRLGYNASDDSIYRLSGKTLSALCAFQRDHGLEEGSVTPETRHALDNALKELNP